jgi:hypothetical protein
MGYICLLLSSIFVIFFIACINNILIGIGKKTDPMYDTIEKKNYVLKKGKIGLIFITVLLILHLTMVLIFYLNDIILVNYLRIIISGSFIYSIFVSIKDVLIGIGKIKNPMYETVNKKKYILRSGIIGLTSRLIIFLLFITIVFIYWGSR